MMKYHSLLARVFMAWMFCTCILIATCGDTTGSFYRWGPHDDLIVLTVIINTKLRYTGLVCFCILNSIFRTLQHDVLLSWAINNVQDANKYTPESIHWTAYEIMSVNAVYTWFDWFIYMHVLLSQIDLFLVETITQLIFSLITTTYYLRTNKNFHQDDNLDALRYSYSEVEHVV